MDDFVTGAVIVGVGVGATAFAAAVWNVADWFVQRRKRKPGPRQYVRYLRHADPEWTGWYIIYVDADGEEYDSMGAYDTKAQATFLMHRYSELANDNG